MRRGIETASETDVIRKLAEILIGFSNIEEIGPATIKAIGIRLTELANQIDMKLGVQQ